MKNNKLFIGLSVLAVAALGYFMWKSKKSGSVQASNQSGEPFIDESTIPPLTTEQEDAKQSIIAKAGQAIGAAIVNSLSSSSNSAPFNDYVVNTSSTNVNVRKSPSTSSTVIGSVAKNAKIKARPSANIDWLEYSKDGKTVFGYVSAAYLKKM